MLKGYRWQLAALLFAAVLFAAALLTRSADSPPPVGESTPTTQAVTDAALTTDDPNITAEPQPVQPTARPTLDPLVVAASEDGIPTYREALVGSVQRINPLFASLNPVDRDITALIFEGLTHTNAYGEPEAALAERWIISADGLEYVVYLRQDARWHDGTPFTAADVAYTMSLLRAADFPGDDALRDFWRTVETETLDTHLVRFRLTQPLGTFLDRLRIGILPEHVLRGTTAAGLAGHPFNFSPIGTGPYQLEALRYDGNRIQAVDLRVAPNYLPRAQAPFAVERVRFQLYGTFDAAANALQNGLVDALATRDREERPPLFLMANERGYTLHNAYEPTIGSIIFNWVSEDTPYFQEQRVRVALLQGLDRAPAVERTLRSGVVSTAVSADSPLIPGSWAYTPELPYPAYDPAAARALLETAFERLEQTADLEATTEPSPAAEATPEATAQATVEATAEAPLASNSPCPLAVTGQLVRFRLMTPDDPALIALACEIATQWAQIGVNAVVEAEPLRNYQARLDAGDFDTALVEYSLGESADPDVYTFWHEGQYPDGKNYGGLSDRRISELLESARREPSGLNRVRDYREFQQIFVERAVALPVYYPLFTYVTLPRVENVQLGFIGAPSDRFRSIGEWTLTSGPQA